MLINVNYMMLLTRWVMFVFQKNGWILQKIPLSFNTDNIYIEFYWRKISRIFLLDFYAKVSSPESQKKFFFRQKKEYIKGFYAKLSAPKSEKTRGEGMFSFKVGICSDISWLLFLLNLIFLQSWKIARTTEVKTDSPFFLDSHVNI